MESHLISDNKLSILLLNAKICNLFTKIKGMKLFNVLATLSLCMYNCLFETVS